MVELKDRGTNMKNTEEIAVVSKLTKMFTLILLVCNTPIFHLVNFLKFTFGPKLHFSYFVVPGLRVVEKENIDLQKFSPSK
jgi:hypothetical protein